MVELTPERWQEVKKVLAAALERPPGERQAYLDQACAEPDMRREVESLIAAHEGAQTTFLAQPAAQVEELAIGSRLGPYEILARLGVGGMGVVYRARDGRLERDVAIKVLPSGLLADERARKRFRTEALALAKLNHPNIATVYDVGEQEGADYLVMECVPGKSLAEEAGSHPVSEKEAVALGVQIATALEEAHEQGIVHRDLKPGNIMVTPKRQIKVLDFGLAKILRAAGDSYATESFTQTQNPVGTLPYMAPEQLRGEPADARTDIHALGAVLFEIVTGKRLYQEDSVPQLTDAILHRQPVAPRALNARVSPEMERIILKCLEKERENRYQSAKELGVDLRRLGTSSAATVPTAVRPESRRRLILPLTGALPLGLAVVAAALFAANVGGLRNRVFRRASAPGIHSLAVLPLENLSGDPQQQYFADGMTEELITELSQVGSLRVVSRTSAMRYKGTQKSVPEIARELNVDAVVEGSVEREGDRVRITAQLVQGPTDTHLWAKGYERDFRDSLRLQDEVAQAIVGEIQLKLTPQEQARFARNDVIDPEAHEDYLRGLFYLNLRDGPDERKAIELFQAAIKKDPSYARAYASLADSYRALIFNSNAAPADVLPQSEAAAKRALEIDDQLAEAHASLATNLADYDWDWAGGEREFQTALRLDPNSSLAHSYHAHFLRQEGKIEESIREGRRGVELDPVSAQANFLLAQSLYEARRYEEAISQLRTALDLEPRFWPAHLYLGKTLAEQGRFQEAIEELKKAGDFTAEPYATIGYVYGRMGRAGDARKVIADLQEQSTKGYVAPTNFAKIYIGLGDKDQAFAWLEKGCRQRDFWISFLRGDPTFDSLRSDPRFRDLVRRIGFPQ
jgi:serine/threonine-protein kinase